MSSQDDTLKENYWEDRVANLKDSVSTYDVLQHYEVRIPSTSRKVSFSCDLHGDGIDKKNSAMYYPQTDTTYCWGCGKARDQIELVRDYEGMEFKEAVKKLERVFDVSNVPSVYNYALSESSDENDEGDNELVNELDSIFHDRESKEDNQDYEKQIRYIEQKIRSSMEDHREETDDPTPFVRCFHILDQTAFHVKNGNMSEDKALKILDDLEDQLQRINQHGPESLI